MQAGREGTETHPSRIRMSSRLNKTNEASFFYMVLVVRERLHRRREYDTKDRKEAIGRKRDSDIGGRWTTTREDEISVKGEASEGEAEV